MRALTAALLWLLLLGAGSPARAALGDSGAVWQSRSIALGAAYVHDSTWSAALAAHGRFRQGRLAGAEGWTLLEAGRLPDPYFQIGSRVSGRRLVASSALVTHALEAGLQFRLLDVGGEDSGGIRTEGKARLESGVAIGTVSLSASAWVATSGFTPALSWLLASDTPAGSLLMRLTEPGSVGLSLEGRRRLDRLTARLGTALRWVSALDRLVPRLWAGLAAGSGPYAFDLGATVDAIAPATGPLPVALAASVSFTRPGAVSTPSDRPRRARLVAWWEAPSDRLGLASALEW
ncbi:MAG TPA: hypothetical protein VIK73_01400 [Limnochordales bacterium]